MIFTLDWVKPIQCVIRNVSVDGAMLACEGPEQLPRHIYLMMHKGSQIFQCEVVWQISNRFFGVRFDSNNSRVARERLVEACALTTIA